MSEGESGNQCGHPGCGREDAEDWIVIDRDACDCGIAQGWRDDPGYPLDGPPACLFEVRSLCPEHAPN